MWEKGDSMRTSRFIVCITWQIVVLTTNVGNTDMGSELIIMGFKKNIFERIISLLLIMCLKGLLVMHMEIII